MCQTPYFSYFRHIDHANEASISRLVVAIAIGVVLAQDFAANCVSKVTR